MSMKIVKTLGVIGDGEGDGFHRRYYNNNLWSEQLEQPNYHQQCIGKLIVPDCCQKCIEEPIKHYDNVLACTGRTGACATPNPSIKMPYSVGNKPVKKR